MSGFIFEIESGSINVYDAEVTPKVCIPLETPLWADGNKLFAKLNDEMEDMVGTNWRTNLSLLIVWKPDVSSDMRKVFKQAIRDNGTDKYGGYLYPAFAARRLGGEFYGERFDKSCSHLMNVWCNGEDVFLDLYEFNDKEKRQGSVKTIGISRVVEGAARDPRADRIIDIMRAKLLSKYPALDYAISSEAVLIGLANEFVDKGKTEDTIEIPLNDGGTFYVYIDGTFGKGGDGAEKLKKDVQKLLDTSGLKSKDIQVYISGEIKKRTDLIGAMDFFPHIYEENDEDAKEIKNAYGEQLAYKKEKFDGLLHSTDLLPYKCKTDSDDEDDEGKTESQPIGIFDNPPNVTLVGELIVKIESSGFFGMKKVRKCSLKINLNVAPHSGVPYNVLLIVRNSLIGKYSADIEGTSYIREYTTLPKSDEVIIDLESTPTLSAEDREWYVFLKPHWNDATHLAKNCTEKERLTASYITIKNDKK